MNNERCRGEAALRGTRNARLGLNITSERGNKWNGRSFEPQGGACSGAIYETGMEIDGGSTRLLYLTVQPPHDLSVRT
jgi:hypothetical protein